MGHSDIGVTLNTYTHVNYEDAREEVSRMMEVYTLKKAQKRNYEGM